MALIGAVAEAFASEDMPQVTVAFAAQDLTPDTRTATSKPSDFQVECIDFDRFSPRNRLTSTDFVDVKASGHPYLSVRRPRPG